MLEVRTPFVLALEELDAVDRGANDPELTPLTDAARLTALAEDRAVFLGYPAASITGIVTASPHQPEMIGEDYDVYPSIVARAVATLRRAGIGGPYAIAMGPRCYTGVVETTEHGGYPLIEHIKMILGGPVVWAPAVEGAVVVSQRGGDYELVCGQDISIGYRTHTEDAVELYFEESMTFVVQDGRAAVSLQYP
jgi:uncharacterized linocin/CFP29 family protein